MESDKSRLTRREMPKSTLLAGAAAEYSARAIAVVRDDKLVFAKGYGVREPGRPAPFRKERR